MEKRDKKERIGDKFTMRHILCKYCYKEVENRDQLVTASNWFRIKPFHYVCFQEIEKETKMVWNSWTPVNGISGNISFMLLSALSVWMLTTHTFGYAGDMLGVIALYPVALRLLSLFFIEMHIPNFKK
jgi:hypothetical protein